MAMMNVKVHRAPCPDLVVATAPPFRIFRVFLSWGVSNKVPFNLIKFAPCFEIAMILPTADMLVTVFLPIVSAALKAFSYILLSKIAF